MFRSNFSNNTLPETREPQSPAEPSYAPFLVALGVTMIFWGIVTSPVMSAGMWPAGLESGGVLARISSERVVCSR